MKCKEGYQKVVGHVSGKGTISDHSITLEKCGEECDVNSECNSYEYSQAGSCQLNKEDQPTNPTNLPSQIVCAKGAVILTNNSTYTEYLHFYHSNAGATVPTENLNQMPCFRPTSNRKKREALSNVQGTLLKILSKDS